MGKVYSVKIGGEKIYDSESKDNDICDNNCEGCSENDYCPLRDIKAEE